LTLVRLICVGICAFALLCTDASAQSRKRVPRFEDYPVKEIHDGKSANLALETDEQRNASTYYQAIADGGTSFAGHYAVVPLTCGPACISADFLDTLSGKIIPGTFSNSGWKERHDAFREIEFRRGSRLIVFAGQIDEKGPLGWHFYVFDQGKMKRIHTVVTKGDFRKPLAEWMR
jgi:hypothetical protein